MHISEKDLTLIGKLRNRKGRREFRRFLVEGVRCVQELVESDYLIDKILINESFLTQSGRDFLKRQEGFPVNSLKAGKFRQIASEKSSQGVIAVVKMKEMKEIDIGNSRFILIAEKISDPSNLGSIIRSAVAFGAKLIIGPDSADIYSPKVISASSGSVFKADLEICPSLLARLHFLRNSSFQIWGGDIAGKDVDAIEEFPPKVALVIGHEAFGLSREIRKLLDLAVTIPVAGKVESLSAPVAAAILLYSLGRRMGM